MTFNQTLDSYEAKIAVLYEKFGYYIAGSLIAITDYSIRRNLLDDSLYTLRRELIVSLMVELNYLHNCDVVNGELFKELLSLLADLCKPDYPELLTKVNLLSA